MNQSLATYFIEHLINFNSKSFRDANAAELRLLNVFIKHFISVVVTDEFRPDRAQMLQLIELSEIIANLVEVSELRTTEPQVLALLPKSADALVLCKLMTLYSPRNQLELSPDLFFSVDAEAASVWYCNYAGEMDWAGIDPAAFARVSRMLQHVEPRLQYANNLLSPYFTCTYVNEASAAPVRRQIHAILQQLAPPLPMVAHGPGNRIGIVSGRWKCDNVVHRALAPFIHALGAKFELTLIHLSDDDDRLDLQGIAGVQHLVYQRERPEAVQELAGRFRMLLFADIGLEFESVYLASLRLAPIQVALCGHPESSWSPAIDYFVHGADVIDAALAQRQFGERLVLIPGCGQVATRPTYEWKRTQPAAQELRIACCWSSQKMRHEHLLRLAAAAADTDKPVKFVFFGLGGSNFLPILHALHAVLGAERVECHGSQDYNAFMTQLESCHFAVDAWPFGGYVTVTDLLWLRKPVVGLRGNRSFSRNAGYLQTALGLPEMVVDTADAFIALLRRMISDDAWREQAITTLQNAEVEQVLLSRQPVASFVAAIQLLLDQHEQLAAEGSREPIRVQV
jgi:hypothetical protein